MILAPLKNLYIYRNLIFQLIRRDVLSRYQGSFLGIAWSFCLPLLTLAVYALVFGVILSPRWPNVSDPMQFTLILFTGLLAFNFFSECVSRAPFLIISNSNYVKKVIFPIDVLVWVPIGSATFHLCLGLIAWTFLVFLFGGEISYLFALLPLVFLPFMVLTVGVSWFLSALGVFIRDVGQVVGVGVQLLLYLGPIIYPIEVLPERFQWLMYLNPVTVPVEQLRNILNFGLVPDFSALLVYTLVAFLVAYLGRLFFEKTRHGFADVI